MAASGTHPKVAQSIMRHSDINLTMSRYTHTLRGQESKAVENLPDLSLPNKKQKNAATGTDGKSVEAAQEQPKKLPPYLTPQLTPTTYLECNQSTANGNSPSAKPDKVKVRKYLPRRELSTESNHLSPSVNGRGRTRPAGLEPATYGLEIRCSVRLSYGRFYSKSW